MNGMWDICVCAMNARMSHDNVFYTYWTWTKKVPTTTKSIQMKRYEWVSLCVIIFFSLLLSPQKGSKLSMLKLSCTQLTHLFQSNIFHGENQNANYHISIYIICGYVRIFIFGSIRSNSTFFFFALNVVYLLECDCCLFAVDIKFIIHISWHIFVICLLCSIFVGIFLSFFFSRFVPCCFVVANFSLLALCFRPNGFKSICLKYFSHENPISISLWLPQMQKERVMCAKPIM